mmetsp:Transcript_5610/g.10877  ORF Transcript_5610/g.10877 Transcript_5610/m.10877 type:complete len:203 (-) Transcript_5610:499-1107(-)
MFPRRSRAMTVGGVAAVSCCCWFSPLLPLSFLLNCLSSWRTKASVSFVKVLILTMPTFWLVGDRIAVDASITGMGVIGVRITVTIFRSIVVVVVADVGVEDPSSADGRSSSMETVVPVSPLHLAATTSAVAPTMSTPSTERILSPGRIPAFSAGLFPTVLTTTTMPDDVGVDEVLALLLLLSPMSWTPIPEVDVADDDDFVA